MMLINVIVIFILALVGLPVLSYLVVKFGTVGYLRAKKRVKP